MRNKVRNIALYVMVLVINVYEKILKEVEDKGVIVVPVSGIAPFAMQKLLLNVSNFDIKTGI